MRLRHLSMHSSVLVIQIMSSHNLSEKKEQHSFFLIIANRLDLSMDYLICGVSYHPYLAQLYKNIALKIECHSLTQDRLLSLLQRGKPAVENKLIPFPNERNQLLAYNTTL